MTSDAPPSMDPRAVKRWHRWVPPASPWLHEEVGRRTADRLQWIRAQPRQWVDWEPWLGGMQAHALVAQRYPKANCVVVESQPSRMVEVRSALARPWWRGAWLVGSGVEFREPDPASAQMLWSNMHLHTCEQPLTLLRRWHRALETQGFLMFSCLGPDSLRGLRQLYAAQGWPPPAHEFTDMHDWGDLLVAVGFAEPVMDMERLSLTFSSPDRLVRELRGLGGNLRKDRFQGLRGRAWRDQLLSALGTHGPDQTQCALEFEVVYGHAVKPEARIAVQAESAFSVDAMRAMLKRNPHSGSGA